MKKAIPVLMTVIIFASLILSSCGGGSVKGKWSESDKQKFYKEMDGVDLSALGENKTKWIDCYFSKVEANYASFDEANVDKPGCEKLATECNDEIFANGSVLGKWSDSDKQKFQEEMEAADLSFLGENKTKWIECYLQKAEAKYSSLYAANKDAEGCKILALECNSEIIK
jgi:hypothetical protein